MRMLKSALIVGPLSSLLSGTAAAQNLADVARAEEARRKTIKGSGKVYTNDTLRGADGGEPLRLRSVLHGSPTG